MADISKFRLPSGNEYEIKDAVARQMISQGLSLKIVWTAAQYASTTAPAASVLAEIPAGVEVYYNNGGSHSTGTLAASADTVGQFYLVYSKTQAGNLDVFEEYATVIGGTQAVPTYSWELIGDTQIDLSNVVTGVTLNKSTDTVLGESTTFALTSGSVTHGTPTTANVIGASSTFTVTQPTISVTPSTTNIKATASGTAVGANGTASAITGFGDHTTDSFVKSVSPTTSKLVTTTVKGVSGSTTASKVTVTAKTASKATAVTSQTTADGTGTASSTNTDWLKGISVSNETLIIGAATMDTQTTTQFTFADVACSSVSASDVTVPTAAATATTVATGSVSDTGSGSDIVTGVAVGDSANAITALGTPTTSTVLTGVKVTAQPTIALATGATAGTGVVSVATGISSASASGGNVAWNSKDQKAAVTAMPTSTVGTGITVGTNDKVTALTNGTSITVTKGE